MLVVSAGGDNGIREGTRSQLYICKAMFFYSLSVILLSLIVELLGYECEGIIMYASDGWSLFTFLTLCKEIYSEGQSILLSLGAGALCNRHDALRVTCTSGSACRER